MDNNAEASNLSYQEETSAPTLREQSFDHVVKVLGLRKSSIDLLKDQYGVHTVRHLEMLRPRQLMAQSEGQLTSAEAVSLRDFKFWAKKYRRDHEGSLPLSLESWKTEFTEEVFDSFSLIGFKRSDMRQGGLSSEDSSSSDEEAPKRMGRHGGRKWKKHQMRMGGVGWRRRQMLEGGGNGPGRGLRHRRMMMMVMDGPEGAACIGPVFRPGPGCGMGRRMKHGLGHNRGHGMHCHGRRHHDNGSDSEAEVNATEALMEVDVVAEKNIAA